MGGPTMRFMRRSFRVQTARGGRVSGVLFYQQSKRYRRLSVPVLPSVRDVEAEHRAIGEAVLARQSARTCELMREHLVLTMRIVVEGLTLRGESN